MGYSYGQSSSGRWARSCDSCGDVGEVRKRTCPFKVLTSSSFGGPRQKLAYCPAPALCGPCFAKHGPAKVLHADCAEGARLSQEKYDAEQALLDSGALLRCSASGDWADWVPAGMVGVKFRNGSSEAAFLMSSEAYDSLPLGVAATPDNYREQGFELTPFEEVPA